MRTVSEGTAQSIRKTIERTMMQFVGHPLNNHTLEAFEAAVHGVLRQFVAYGELDQFDPTEVRVSVDPWDPSMIRVRIGRDFDLTGPCDTMADGKGTE